MCAEGGEGIIIIPFIIIALSPLQSFVAGIFVVLKQKFPLF
jgi:hypothetical protein